MSSDDKSKHISRRRVTSGIIAGGLISLSGCTNYLDQDAGPEYADPSASISGLSLQEIQEESGSDEFTVAVSDDVMNSEDYSLFNGQQVRIKVTTQSGSRTLSSLYTITTDPGFTSEEESTVWMTGDGISRINTSSGSTVDLVPYSTSPIYFDRDAGKTNNEFIEQANDSESDTLFMAPHGGEITQYTELQAFRGASEEDYCVWSALGYGETSEQAYERWYNPEEKYDVDSFVRLQELSPPFNLVVSFVGNDDPIKKVGIGGLGSSQLKEYIERELRYVFHGEGESVTGAGSESESDSSTEDDGTSDVPSAIDDAVNISIEESGEQGGVDPQLISNQLSEEGTGTLRLSQSDSVREQYWSEIANAVVRVVEYLDLD